MLKKKDICDKIINALRDYVSVIKVKAENNLLDDNVLSEDFIKDLLNTCKGWNLVNLNTSTSQFPGIDLGDKERHIGVQVTSTKTSKKILDSLDMIVSNGIDKEYNEIYFFILGEKQKKYSVDFSKYETLDCSKENIWDVNDVFSWCTHYDYTHVENVWNLIKRELVEDEIIKSISIEIKKNIIELKQIIKSIFESCNYMHKTHNILRINMDDIKEACDNLDLLLPYLDERTYTTCKEVLENGLQLSKTLQTCHKWEWKIEAQCIIIENRILVQQNLLQAAELISKDIQGLPQGVDIIIDGESLFDRLTELGIDEDILYKQFSIEKLQNVIEQTILRKIRDCMIAFSEDSGHSNRDLINRLQEERIEVVIFDKRQGAIDFVYEKIKESVDLVVLSNSEDMLNKVSTKKRDCYLYTVSFENDLRPSVGPTFFAKGNITLIELNACFNYNECKKINIHNITETIFKEMLANANDEISHQLRVDWEGNVFLSTITGAKEIDDVKFRWESWDAGNGYVGPRAASDDEYVKHSIESLQKCWKDDVRGYCDDYWFV